MGETLDLMQPKQFEAFFELQCGLSYRLAQWSIWFEFFLLIVMLVTCFLNAFERARFIYLTYLALVTSLLTITSRNFITATVMSYYDNNGVINIKDTKQSANNAAAAGAIMLCITNYALIIFIGLGRWCWPSA